MTTIRISATGEIHGWGSDPYKWVSKLTACERMAVQAGETVLVEYEITRPGNQCGWKRVTYSRGRWGHREATAEQALFGNRQRC